MNLNFHQWYSIYPRKIARGDAEKAYNQQLKKGYTHDELLAGLNGYNALIRKDGTDRKFVPYPATWLRSQRWLDEDIQPQPILSPEEIEANKDRADRLLRRGAYDPMKEFLCEPIPKRT